MGNFAVTVMLSKDEIKEIFNSSDYDNVDKKLGEKVREAVIKNAFRDILREVGADDA